MVCVPAIIQTKPGPLLSLLTCDFHLEQHFSTSPFSHHVSVSVQSWQAFRNPRRWGVGGSNTKLRTNMNSRNLYVQSVQWLLFVMSKTTKWLGYKLTTHLFAPEIFMRYQISMTSHELAENFGAPIFDTRELAWEIGIPNSQLLHCSCFQIKPPGFNKLGKFCNRYHILTILIL